MAQSNFITIRLAPAAIAELSDLGRQTGRSRSNVARALLLTALSDPNYRRLLGELPGSGVLAGTQPAQEQPT